MPNWIAIAIVVGLMVLLIRHSPSTGKCAACGKPSTSPECEDCAKITRSAW